MLMPLKLASLPNGNPGVTDDNSVFTTRARIERQKQQAFEAGRRAGLEHAEGDIQARNHALISSINDALQAISFTHTEARRAVLLSLAPLVRKIIDQFLPGIRAQAAGMMMADQILDLADTIGDEQITIRCNPADYAALGFILSELSGATRKTSMISDHRLKPGELTIALTASELKIDIDAAIADLRSAFDSFFSTDLGVVRNASDG